MGILLIEADKKITLFVRTGLTEAGFAVDHVIDGEEGLHLALTKPYDLAVIDLMLPTVDGLTIIKEMRMQQIDTPVLIISANSTLDERIKVLQAGGDDCLVKPFAFSELSARVQVLMRRSSWANWSVEFKVADLTLNLHSRKVLRAGREIHLHPVEFSLLEYLMRNSRLVVSKTMIIEHVWDFNFNPMSNVVESHICYLRDKIDKEFDAKLIHTVRGVGYVLKENWAENILDQRSKRDGNELTIR